MCMACALHVNAQVAELEGALSAVRLQIHIARDNIHQLHGRSYLSARASEPSPELSHKGGAADGRGRTFSLDEAWADCTDEEDGEENEEEDEGRVEDEEAEDEDEGYVPFTA